MKRYFILTIVLSLSLYSQFSSSINYSQTNKADRFSSEIGSVLNVGGSETEWKVTFAGKKIEARSKIFKFGYGLDGKNIFDKIELDYSLINEKLEMSNSASVDTILNDQAGLTNYDLDDLSLSLLKFRTGISYNDKYCIHGFFENLTSDHTDDNSFQTGVGLKYKYLNSAGNEFSAFFEYSTTDGVDEFAFLSTITGIKPVYNAGLKYIRNSEISSFITQISYFEYDEKVLLNKDLSYINIKGSYFYRLKRAETEIQATAGTNLTTSLEVPESILPYFYYDMEFAYNFSDHKFKLSAGWNYSLTNSLLMDKYDILSVVHEDLNTLENTEETKSSNKLYIKFIYRY